VNSPSANPATTTEARLSISRFGGWGGGRGEGAEVIAALVCALLLFVSVDAQAGVFDIFGFGSRNVAMGGTGTASADDHTAAFYNPAALTRRKVVHLGMSFTAYFSQLSIDTHGAAAAGLTPSKASSPAGISFGVLFPVGGKIERRVALGLGLYIPFAHALALEALEPSVPRWYRYNTLEDKLHIVAAVGFELTDWVSIGIGIQSLADLEGELSFQVDLSNEAIHRRDAKVELINTASPTVGFLFTLLRGSEPRARGWTLGATYRGPVELAYTFPLRFDFGDAFDLTLNISGIDLYTPHTLAFGTAYEFGSPALTIALDATVGLWSLAPDPSLQVTVLGTGDLVDGLGLDDYLNMLPGANPPAGFRDTVNLAVGVEHRPLDWLTLRAGYAWKQAVLAEQTQASSYLDSDAHCVSAGVAFSAPDPLEMNDRPVILDLTGNATFHPNADVTKADPNAPIHQLTFGGQIWGLAISVRHDF